MVKYTLIVLVLPFIAMLIVASVKQIGRDLAAASQAARDSEIDNQFQL